MFIIVPAILIFLAFSSLYLNEDISMIWEVFIYVFIFGVVLFSLYIYRSLQKNLQQQEINKILLEIHQLQQKLKNSPSKTQQNNLTLKINKLEKESQQYQSKTFF